jgi:hypothetical protein
MGTARAAQINSFFMAIAPQQVTLKNSHGVAEPIQSGSFIGDKTSDTAAGSRLICDQWTFEVST